MLFILFMNKYLFCVHNKIPLVVLPNCIRAVSLLPFMCKFKTDVVDQEACIDSLSHTGNPIKTYLSCHDKFILATLVIIEKYIYETVVMVQA